MEPSVAAQDAAALCAAYFANDEADAKTEEENRAPEEPAGLNYTVSAETGGWLRVQAAEHDDCVLADAGVLTESHAAEEIHHVLTDGTLIRYPRAAEKVYNIVLGVAVDPDVAKEDDSVVIQCAVDIHAAEETDRIVYCVVRSDVDGASEVHNVLGGPCGCCESGSQ